MELDTSFSQEDRNRIQAIKAQLKWKCINFHQGTTFRLVSNPYKCTHTIYFPKDTDANPTFYHYILELSRAFYSEKYGPSFGDVYFDPSIDKAQLPLYSALISCAQHWFTAGFCHANFAQAWHNSLDIKYQSLVEKPEDITSSTEQTLSAALICAQVAWIRQESTSSVIAGSLQQLVNCFTLFDPTKVALAPLATLVNSLLEVYQPGNTLQFNEQEQGGFWKSL